MTPAEFKKKWAKVTAKEMSAYQSHFDDLCRLLHIAPPLEADPSGETFCFQKRVLKDMELFAFDDSGQVDESAEGERGFADVWKKGCFAWEYKGKKKNLDEAYRQLLRYRESLLNPPLLVVCDFDRFIIRTNFNGTVQETHEFTNAQIEDPKVLTLLRHVFTDPEYLKPQRTTAEVTEILAREIADVAKSLQKREVVELTDAKSRKELNFGQRQNLRIARFLNRIIFCFFAEDTGLLPKGLFSSLLKGGLDDPRHLATTLESLFNVMATGGVFGKDKIRHFNGHLFEEATVFELSEDELRKLCEASEADWQFIQPSIMGTLFSRALEPEQRSQLGAHYTCEEDIKTLVEPVLMAPLRREWTALKKSLTAAYVSGKGTAAQREQLSAFQKKLAALTVLDPACGSGNFLYVSLQLLLDLEKDVIAYATQLGFKLTPLVGVQQLRGIEINPYAYELAQVSVQIGFLQWRRDNGFSNDRSPVLQNLDGFQNEDALLVPHFRSKARSLKEAQAGEHKGDDALKFYTERDWPKCDVIVGNPPFLGDKIMRRELSDTYVEELRRTYEGRIPGQSDLCCYWFEKARALIEAGHCKRAGLLATQGIRGGANREVLKRIKDSGDIFFAVSDRDWILAGAAVHVSMVGFDNGGETARQLDGLVVTTINSQLTATAPTASARPLTANRGISFIGTTKKAPLDIEESRAVEFLFSPNPTGRPNSEVVLPWMNGLHVTRRAAARWIIDYPMEMRLQDAAGFSGPFAYVEAEVKPHRIGHREAVQAKYWWRQARPCPELRKTAAGLLRYFVTPRVAKHRIIAWVDSAVVPDCQLVAFARSDYFSFGVVHSRFHEVWSLAQGTQLREKESGFRYTPTTCFETFPFPFPDDLEARPYNAEAELNAAKHYAHIVLRDDPPPQTPGEHRDAIAAAAKELNELRERWLNPPEWTETRMLEFPGTEGGPWSRFLDPKTVDARTGIGTVRWPRLEPRDADCSAKLKRRTLTNLYNERPAWLDLAHKKLDAAVATAYGWPADLSDAQILENLLALNLARAAEEAKSSAAQKPKAQRAKRTDELI